MLEKYQGRFTKIRVKDELDIEYLSNPDKLLEGKKPSLWSAIDKNKGFEIKSRQIHFDKYSYEFSEYINDHDKVKILCPIHGMFQQTPSNHLRGQGCPKCGKESARKKWAKNGFSRTAWIKYCRDGEKFPKVYILRCYGSGESFVKIGVTTRTINGRFWKTNMPYEYEIIYVSSGSPEYVYDKEKSLHRRFKQYKYNPLIHFDGYRECFNCSIINDSNGKGVIP